MDNEQQQQQSSQQVVSSSESHQNGRVASENYREGREKRVPHHHLASQPKGNGSNFPGFFGKHRLQAAISHLNNQINITQEELEQLETIGESSTVCKEVISSVESIPDPLLPMTKGIDADWDRWFGGAHNSRNNKRWI